MINRIDNTKQSNYKPSFGTTVTITNKLNPLLQHHKDVAPLLRGLEESAEKVRNNGKIDDMQVTIKKGISWFKKYIKAEYKISRADGQKVENSANLLRYTPATGKIKSTNALKNLTKPENVISGIYKDAVPIADTRVNHQLPPKLYTMHEDTHPYFKAIEDALDEIGYQPTEGLFNVSYKLVKDKNAGTTSMEMHYGLESATKINKKENVSSYRYQPLFKFNEDMSTCKKEDGSVIFDTEISTPEELKVALIKDFNNQKAMVDKQIANLSLNKK